VKKVWINTDVDLTTAGGLVQADVDIDPLIVGIGLGYRW
jgi:outer membrane protein